MVQRSLPAGTALRQGRQEDHQDLIAELTAKCGEKIVIRRFVRFQLGEGIEKVKTDFAAEVAAELAKVQQ